MVRSRSVAPRHYRLDWPLLALAAALVVPLYWPTLRYDLFQDDFLLLRPWVPDHLVASWFGGWYVAEHRDFYRPFAILLYKAMFDPFGLNTRALHILPLVTIAVVAWMLGRFVRRETGSWSLATMATVLCVVHPTSTVAVGPWLANQYQGLISAALLASLLWWQTARTRPWPWSLPLLVPIIIGAFTKETGLIIPAVLVAIAVARGWWTRDLAPPPRWFIVAGLVVFAVLNLWRLWALGGVGGGDDFLLQLNGMRYYDGWSVTLFNPVSLAWPLWKWSFAAMTALLVVGGAWALLRRERGAAAILVLTGAMILAFAALPTSLVFSRDRLTPHVIGAVLLMTGGFAVAQQYLVGRARAWLVAGTLVLVGSATMLTQQAILRFGPCQSGQLSDPESLLNEPRSAPPELIRWLGVIGSQPCSLETHTPFFRAASRITWDVIEHNGERPVHERLHVWTRRQVVALLDARGTAVIIEVRHPAATPSAPVVMHVVADGTPETQVVLATPEWTRVTVPLTRTWLTWTRQMHRLTMELQPSVAAGMEMRPLDGVY
jgi:hypothetical protein